MRLAPHARLPVRIARRVRHHAGAPVEADRDILARGGQQAVVAGEAAVRGLKLRLSASSAASRVNAERGEHRRTPDAEHARRLISIPPGSRRRTSPTAGRRRSASTVPAVLATGPARPTFARICCRRLSVTWNCGMTSHIGLRARQQIAVGQQLHASATTCGPTPSSCRKLLPSAVRQKTARGAVEYGSDSPVPACAWRNELPGRIWPNDRKALEDRHAAAEPFVAVAGRQDDLALHAERSRMRAGRTESSSGRSRCRPRPPSHRPESLSRTRTGPTLPSGSRAVRRCSYDQRVGDARARLAH